MKRSTISFAAVLVALAACDDSSGTTDLSRTSGGRATGGDGTGADDGTGTGTDGTNGGGPGGTAGTAAIDSRVTDYGEALRSASLKLVGELPTLAEIKTVGDAADDNAKKAALAAAVDKYLADPRFTDAQLQWWRNTMKTGNDGGRAPNGMPSFDTAATFAAEVVVKDRPYTDLFTATTGTCPTYANGTFTDANCTTQAKVSGVLTDPGLMAQYMSNMAFRRVRFIQEVFDCAKFPIETAAQGIPMGAGTYNSPWKFESITGGTGTKVNFQDTSAVVCANCHATMNHIAPLFANFDAKGAFQNAIQVETPVTPPVKSILSDWIPAGEPLAWRSGQNVTDIPSLGQAMAKDPAVMACAVTRVWNWALSRGDIVNDGATVPATVVKDQVASFQANGFKLKPIIRSVFTSDDFAKF